MLVDIDCGEPDRPDTSGGLVVAAPDTDFNNTAVYSCDMGFVIKGNATRRCQENGNWSDVAPRWSVLTHPYTPTHARTHAHTHTHTHTHTQSHLKASPDLIY